MSSATSAGKPDRLFVGNLAPSVDEYTLVQVFSKYGKITKLDVMVHHSGPQKGKPRGYAFVEFESKDDAVKALVKLHDRLLRGRKLVVTYANAAPVEEGAPRRRPEAKPTSLSLLKARKPQSTDAQIAAMEAKLAALRNRPDRSPTPERVAADELEAEIMREIEAAGVGGKGEQGGDGGRGDEEGRRGRADSPPPIPSPAAPAPGGSAPVSRGASPMPGPGLPGLAGMAGLPAKPVAAMQALKPRDGRERDGRDSRDSRNTSRNASPRRHDRYTPGREAPGRDRSPRRDAPDRYRDSPQPRSRDRSPRPPRPREASPAAASRAFQAGLAGLPKKPVV